jgi:uncharacterized protein YndB with AHSA1/START domain
VKDDILGAVLADGDRRTLRMERVYRARKADLWSAISDPVRLQRWFARVEGDLREGGGYTAVFDEESSDGRITGKILRCRPHSHLLVSWVFPDGEETLLSVDLREEGEGTLFVLEHSRIPKGPAAGYAAGWQAYLEQLEPDVSGAEGRPERPSWDERWAALNPAYDALARQAAGS